MGTLVGSPISPPFGGCTPQSNLLYWCHKLVFAFGALKLRPWAWYLGLIATGITVLGVIINLFQGASIWSAVMGSVLSIVIFIYLLAPKVRAAFGIGSQTPEPVETSGAGDAG